VELLVNKFRNKYNINSSSEMEVDLMIRKEVTQLLNDGNTYEGNLYKLDKKIEQLIKDQRAGLIQSHGSVRGSGYNGP
jgi:hypothetical protein